jgi:hypothetical protein
MSIQFTDDRIVSFWEIMIVSEQTLESSSPIRENRDSQRVDAAGAS